MIKKMFFVAGAAGLLAVMAFGRDAASYVATGTGRMREAVRGSVPMEFEIDRARRMVRELTPDIRRNMHMIAKEEVELERLEKQIAQSETRLEKDRAAMARLSSDLSSAKNEFHYAGHSYTPEQVKQDLANRFSRVKTADATLTSMREIHDARTRSLSSARQKLEGMLVAKRQLEVEVENLEARLKAVEVAQTSCNFRFDDSHLSRTRELITDLQTRLQVDEKLANAEESYPSEIAVDEPSSDTIVDQVTEYLDDSKTPEKRLASTASIPVDVE